MAEVCPLDALVVTEALLRQQHQGQEELRLLSGAVITPTGWDYIRQHRLKVTRGAALGLIPELTPSSLVQEGRCDHPDRPCGCQTEEFGSGFVEPQSCGECAIHQSQGGCGPACKGCNRHKSATVLPGVSEDLVRQITAQVMTHLGQR